MKIFLAALFIQGLVLALAQAPASAPASASASAPTPTPTGPTNIMAVLTKAGQFTTFMRLIDSTEEDVQINSQLKHSNNQGLTIFAPTDNAFSSLKSGLLNSLSDQRKVQLVQFHILPTFLSLSNFQTASNPLTTQAGSSGNGEFPLNVTTAGKQVNITTGIVNTTVSSSIYSDGQLAVYQVDRVLLPLAFFRTPAPAPSPTKSKPKKKGAKSGDTSDASTVNTANSSGTSELIVQLGSKLAVLVASFVAAFFML